MAMMRLLMLRPGVFWGKDHCSGMPPGNAMALLDREGSGM